MSIEIKVPSPGESISEVTVSKWLKQVGDYVQLDEPLVELERPTPFDFAVNRSPKSAASPVEAIVI